MIIVTGYYTTTTTKARIISFGDCGGCRAILCVCECADDDEDDMRLCHRILNTYGAIGSTDPSSIYLLFTEAMR